MEDDIFKLLMIVLLLANDKTGSRDNVFTELNTIIILGLIMGQNRNGSNPNPHPPVNPNEADCTSADSRPAVDNPRENRRNRRTD